MFEKLLMVMLCVMEVREKDEVVAHEKMGIVVKERVWVVVTHGREKVGIVVKERVCVVVMERVSEVPWMNLLDFPLLNIKTFHPKRER